MTPLLPVAELSTRTRPQDDLWAWVNESWLETDPIPADRSRYGLSEARRAEVAHQLRALVTDADGPASAVTHLYGMLTDTAAREAAGLGPIADELARVDGVTTRDELLHTWGRLQREGVKGPFSLHVLPREDDATRWQLSLFQDGTTLPVPGMYEALGAPLLDTAKAIFELAGLPAAAAERALAVEQEIAAVAWAEPEGRGEADLVNPRSWQQLTDELGLDLTPWVESLGIPAVMREPEAVWNLCQPSYASGLARLLQERPLEDWRDHLRWRVLTSRAGALTPGIEEAWARFHDCVLAGQAEPAPAWRRAVSAVQEHLPMDLARLWVQRYADPAARERTLALAEELRTELRRTLASCPWLGEESRALAITKLDAVILHVGWPQEWETVGELPDQDPVAALRRCARRAHDRETALLGGPVDRGRWGPPPTVVNTFYHPFFSSVTIEGASLPPTEALDDRAVLLGRYGSIIGHELGHAFDSRGSTRDPEGRLRDWWTPAERAAFEVRARAVEEQVHGYRPRGVEDASLDGGRVGAECVAELIGLQLAWDTYLATTTPEEREERVDELTGPERFFAAKAYGRRAADRPATARNRLQGDPHPPFEVYANLARNVDGFHETFGTRPGDGMWLAPDERVRVL